MADVKKSEIYPVFGCEICFVAIYAIFCLNCFVVIYALLCGKKLSQKLYRWRKNDKYEVWVEGVGTNSFWWRLPTIVGVGRGRGEQGKGQRGIPQWLR